jgi:putative zinc finger/helix-turn-helix YgiT family protein
MKKKCRTCKRGEMTVQKETHLYTECGLPNVVLSGVDVRRCKECGAFELVLPNVAELHRVIAHDVIKKPAFLSGAEVRFLRTYLGWTGADFAEHIGVDPSTVSKWENDKDPIGMQSDRALRLMVLHRAPVADYSLDELKKIESRRAPARVMKLRSKNHGWELTAP